MVVHGAEHLADVPKDEFVLITDTNCVSQAEALLRCHAPGLKASVLEVAADAWDPDDGADHLERDAQTARVLAADAA